VIAHAVGNGRVHQFFPHRIKMQYPFLTMNGVTFEKKYNVGMNGTVLGFTIKCEITCMLWEPQDISIKTKPI